MGYQVIWLDDAIDDLGQAVKFIARHNLVAARRTGETILQKVQLLGQFPRMGRIFAKLGRDDVREYPVPPYRVIYQLQDVTRIVHIVTVWHGARSEPDIFPPL